MFNQNEEEKVLEKYGRNINEDVKKRNNKIKKPKKNYYKEDDPFDIK